jgi:peptidoglycan/xylan/chitin deacetylase (PgdA/CDA1 family)
MVKQIRRWVSLALSVTLLFGLMAFGAYELGLVKYKPIVIGGTASAGPAVALPAHPSGPSAGPAVALPAHPSGPLRNSCAAGLVTLTFDDGPSTYTQAVIDTLVALHLKATFFVIGQRVQADPAIIREEDGLGFVIGDHTWNHRSATGFGPKTVPLTGSQWAAELAAGSAAIVKAGAPKPVFYRPPYDDINDYYNAIAAGLGLHVVMGYGNNAVNHVVDSADWSGLSAGQIASRVINGYPINGFHMPGIQNGSIVIFHDGQPTAPNVIAALPAIVSYMNAHNLCSSPVPTAVSHPTGSVVASDPKPVTVPLAPVPPAIGSLAN